jgi:tetratricopeptide (TPR) repeat protein
MPYERNPHFVGREDLLKFLRGMLQETMPRKYNHRVAIYGMGGVGKTQVAIGYVYEYQNDYDNMYWVSASDQTALLSGFGKMAAQTKCLPPGMEGAKPTDVATAVLTWLRTQQNWLLVIDNLDDLSVADGFLPALDSGGHTLITTRNPDIKAVPAEGFEIPVLGHAVAVELLRLRSDADGHDIENAANDIVKELGYLPLAIDHAAAFIRSTSSDLSTFLQIFRQSRKEVLSRPPTSKHAYPNSIAAMFLLSFNKIKEDPIYGAQASRLLELFAFLNPDGILIDFLDAGSSGLNSELREIVDNKLVFNESLGLLQRFSLIGRARRRAITVHRLVQAVLIDNLVEPEMKDCWTGVIELCWAAWPETWDTKETRGLCRNFESQVTEPALKAAELPSKDAAVTLRRIGSFLSDEGNWKDSERFEIRSYEILDSLFGSDDQNTLTSMNNLAVTYERQGRLLEAADLNEKVLGARRRMLGEEHPETLTSMNNLAETYRGQGRLLEAADMHERELEICKRILGEEHPETLTSMNNLAATYWDQERLKDAADLEESVMKAWIKNLGGEHPDTLSTMNNLAYMYESLGRATEAVSLMQRSVEGSRKVLGEEHPDTIRRTDKLERSLLDSGNPVRLKYLSVF